jgi:CHASE3 domain sensor protein
MGEEMTAFDFLLYVIAGVVIVIVSLIIYGVVSFVKYIKVELTKREINTKKMERNVWN